MKVNVIALDDTNYCNIPEEDRPFIKAVLSVYAYTPEERTFCCEITPSRELRSLYTTLDLDLDTPEDKREELWEKYCSEYADDTYMHCSAVDKLKVYSSLDFDSWEEAIEHYQGNCPV